MDGIGKGSEQKQMKLALKLQRKIARRSLHHAFASEATKFKDFRKELRGLHFQAKILPMLIKALNVMLGEAVASMSLDNGAAQEGAASVLGGLLQAMEKLKAMIDEGKNGQGKLAPLIGIYGCATNKEEDKKACLVGLLKDYVEKGLTAKVEKILTDTFDKGVQFVTEKLEWLIGILKNAIITAVASIPFIGGLLARLVTMVLDHLSGLLTKAIAAPFAKIRQLIVTKVVQGISSTVFKKLAGGDVQLELTNESQKRAAVNGDFACRGEVDKTQRSYASEAATLLEAGGASDQTMANVITDANAEGDEQARLEEQINGDMADATAEDDADDAEEAAMYEDL